MLTLNIYAGISRVELLRILSRGGKDSHWDSLHLVGLCPEDVVMIQPILLSFLAERYERDEYHWNTLLVFWQTPSTKLEQLIHEILNLQIFHSIYFKCPNTSSPFTPAIMPDMKSLPRSIFARAISSSSSIETLTLCNTTLSREDTKALYDATRDWYCYQSTTATPPSFWPLLRTLEFISCCFEEGAFYHIGNAIRALPCLDGLKLWYSELSYDDQVHLLRCLWDHPSLTRLDWMERTAGASARASIPSNGSKMEIDGSATTTTTSTIALAPSLEEAMGHLLASEGCHIRMLGLSVGSLALVGSIFSRLTRNRSVEGLDLSYNGCATTATAIIDSTSVETQVFGNLYKFHNLRNLDLFCTRLSATAFRSMIIQPVTTLEHISCWGDDLWRGSATDHAETVLEILESHPNFIEFYGGLHWRTIQVQFLFDIRRVYRRNVSAPLNNNPNKQPPRRPCEDEDILPSLWPIILERASRLLPSDLRRSRAMYWLLHEGPAFPALPLDQVRVAVGVPKGT